MTDLSRRTFLRGAALIVAAPAIVRFSSLMPVRAVPHVLTIKDVRNAIDMLRANNVGGQIWLAHEEFLYGRSIMSIFRDEQNRMSATYRSLLDVMPISDNRLVVR